MEHIFLIKASGAIFVFNLNTSQSYEKIICFMALCLFTACGGDEKDESLIGKWKYEKVEVDFKTNSSSVYDALIKKQIEQQLMLSVLGKF